MMMYNSWCQCFPIFPFWFTRGEGHAEECLQSLGPQYPWLFIPALALWAAGAFSSLGMVQMCPRARCRTCDLSWVLRSSRVLWAHGTKHPASLVNRAECWVKTPVRVVWCYGVRRGSHWGGRKVSTAPADFVIPSERITAKWEHGRISSQTHEVVHMREGEIDEEAEEKEEEVRGEKKRPQRSHSTFGFAGPSFNFYVPSYFLFLLE